MSGRPQAVQTDIVFQDEVEDKGGAQTPWRLLIVDDDRDVHIAMKLALGTLRVLGRPLEFSQAYSAAEARGILSEDQDFAVILLDVVMETEDAGLKLVRLIREELNLADTRIVLRTGQAGYAPELDTITNYDINDYRAKSELTRTRLFSTITTALRSYSQLQQLRQANTTLERLVRDVEILNVEYLEQREAAFEASKAKSRLLANISHELRTPLNAIIGFGELVRISLKEDQKSADYATEIIQAGQRLAAIVDNILDFASIEGGKNQVFPEPQDVAPVLEFAAQLFENDARLLGVRLSFAGGAGNPRCLVDRSAFSKVINHLIANALRYSPKGGEVVLRVEAEGDQTIVSVSDQGPGIPDAIKQNLDAAFQIGEDVMTKRRSGLGLGLFICEKLVKALNGRMEVLDLAPTGSSVRVLLPSAGSQ